MLLFGSERSLFRRILLCSVLIGLAFVLEGLERAVYPIRFEWRDLATDSCGSLAAMFWASFRLIRSSH
jgi:uncharacterized protein YjeT (DUF2065 family)